MSVPPTHIPLPLSFYTPPTSPPLLSPSPSLYFTPPSSPLPNNTDDPFPLESNPTFDLVDDPEAWSVLEKIYLYAVSKSVYHRVFIAHALPDYLFSVTPKEALEYVLPLIRTLAEDHDDQVQQALAAELVPIIWWYFTQCQIIPNVLEQDEAYASSSTTATISVEAFKPILGPLLLSSNPLVGGAARFAVVNLLSRMKKADDREHQSGVGASYSQKQRHRLQSPTDINIIHPWELNVDDEDDEDDEQFLSVGLFGRREREMFTQQILQEVVIGIGRLEPEETHTHPVHEEQSVTHLDTHNPYFPPLPSSTSSSVHQNGFSHHENGPARRALNQNASSLPTHSQRPLSSAISPLGSEATNGGSSLDIDQDDNDWDDIHDGDVLAAVGRLSSMSLIAAVTASGVLGQEAQLSFVEEVERVGHDAVYWVRREASFALGALAKVVPQEVVLNSLLPLFVTLRQDPVWHVRHSALFALPAILSRLSPAQRRTMALETILCLSADKHPTVRSGVLEALGEVIYTFHGQSDGPPEQLIHLFLGRKEDRRVRDGQQIQEAQQGQGHQNQRTPIEEFYADLKRPLICAFNFPAVAYTLGGERWGELREAYLDIASDTRMGSEGVRKTLAASLGELAKIIGPVNAKRDLLGVWRSSIQSEDEEVRMKAIESLHGFIDVVGKEVGKPLVRAVLTEWDEGKLRGWRERECVEKNLVGWIKSIGLDNNISLARAVLRKGLEDNVAVVREVATLALPEIWDLFSVHEKGVGGSSAVDDLRSVLEQLATSSNYRRRMTSIACQQTLALSTNKEGRLLIERDENILRSVADLANDGIEGVRIGVARFAAAVYNTLVRRGSQTIPNMLRCLVQQLLRDSSHEVQSYVASLSGVDTDVDAWHENGEDHQSSGSSSLSNEYGRTARKRLAQLATFSRPPVPASRPPTPTPTPTTPTLGPTATEAAAGPGILRVMDKNVCGDSVRSSSDAECDDSLRLGGLTRPGGNNGTPCESAAVFGPSPISVTTSTGGLRGVYPTTPSMGELGPSTASSNANERVTVPV